MTSQSSRTPPDDVRAAFRDLHGARLHAFALLLTLGDRSMAATLASESLAAGIARLDDLRHPERAAAWLRGRVVEEARGPRSQDRSIAEAAISAVGADAAVLHALAALSRTERAALIASAIERLDRRDVGLIVNRSGAALDRLVRRARDRYAGAYAAPEPPAHGGPIVSHVHEVARRALA